MSARADRKELRRLGLQGIGLDRSVAERGLAHFMGHRRSLTVRDCFPLALAKQTETCGLV
jgi:hypothetical protein